MGSLGETIANGHGDHASNSHVNGKPSGSAVLHRSLHHEPLHAISAKGNYLYLSNGQKIFDATGGAAVACLGSGDQRYGRNILKQTPF